MILKKPRSSHCPGHKAALGRMTLQGGMDASGVCGVLPAKQAEKIRGVFPFNIILC